MYIATGGRKGDRGREGVRDLSRFWILNTNYHELITNFYCLRKKSWGKSEEEMDNPLGPLLMGMTDGSHFKSP